MMEFVEGGVVVFGGVCGCVNSGGGGGYLWGDILDRWWMLVMGF